MEILRDLEGTPELDDELALYNKVGDLYLKVRNVNGAVEMYERAVDRYTESGFPNNAIALCNKILRSAPGRTHVYLKLAQLMVQRGFIAEAKKNFVEYADRMSSDGKLDEAFSALKRFADISPENEEIRLMLVEQLRAAARDDEAREQIDKLITETDKKDTQRASRIMERVRAVDPEYDLDNADVGSTVTRGAKTKNSDLIFISLDEEEAVAAKAASPEPTPDVPIEEMETVQVDALQIDTDQSQDVQSSEEIGVGTDGLEIQRGSIQAEAIDFEQAPGESLDGLEALGNLAEDASTGVDTGALELERTSLGDDEGETSPRPSSLELPELDLDALEGKGAEGDEVETADIGLVEFGSSEADKGESTTELIGLDALDDDAVGDQSSAVDVDAVTVPVGLPPLDDELEADEVEEVDVEDSVLFIDETEPLAAVIEEPAQETLEDFENRVADAPDDFGLRRQFAERLLEEGDRERGIEELDHVISGFERQSDWARASTVADEILRLDPNRIALHQKQVEFTYRQGDRPRLIKAYLDLADALFRTGALDNARAINERVLELDPNNAQANEALATLTPTPKEPAPTPAASKASSPKEFVDLGEFILGDDEAPTRDTRMRVEQDAPTGDEQKDFQDMLQQFKRGIEENLAEEDTQAHYDLGVAFKEMGLLDEAIGEFQKSLRALETRLASAEMLGLCFFEKGQFEVAATVLRRAVDGDPSSDQEKVGVLYWLGRCEQERGKDADALVYYQRVFAVDISFKDVGGRVKSLVQAIGR